MSLQMSNTVNVNENKDGEDRTSAVSVRESVEVKNIHFFDDTRKPTSTLLEKCSEFIRTPSVSLMHLGNNKKTSLKLLQTNPDSKSLHHRVKEWIAPSDTPTNAKLFGGRRAIQEEQIRSKKAGWIIHPYSSLRYYWDIFVMLILLLNMIILPLNIAFFGSGQSWAAWMTIHTISDITFLTDVILNFRTGYKEDDTGYNIAFILEPKLIAKRYAKSWFCIDLVSSIPFDNVILLVTGGNGENYGIGVQSAFRGFKFLRLVKLLSLLKLLRLSRIMRFVTKYEDFYHMTASVMRYVKLVLMMLMVAHWNGCLSFLVPMLQDFPRNSWVALNHLEESDWTEQYGWALFKALSHMLCIGYGRFIPMLLSEACLTIFSMITGATFYALFIAHSMAYIQQRDAARRLYQEKFQQIEEYMRYRDLPQTTRERITDYYEHKYFQKKLFNEAEILHEISKPLRDDVINHNCRDLIESVPFLREGGHDFITLITNSLMFDVYLPGDVVIKEGTFGNEMFFIRNGTVEVEVEKQHISVLEEGNYFGEITMLTNSRRVATVKAVNVCDLFILTRENLFKALHEFPEMRTVMEQVALDRLTKLKEKFPGCVNTAGAAIDLKNRQAHGNNIPTHSSSTSMVGNVSVPSFTTILEKHNYDESLQLKKNIFLKNNQIGISSNGCTNQCIATFSRPQQQQQSPHGSAPSVLLEDTASSDRIENPTKDDNLHHLV